MEEFHQEDDGLYCEGVPLSEIARSVGTPTYVYSHAALENAYRELDEAFSSLDHLVCYAVKANGNLAVLRSLASFGAGADIVSGRRVVPGDAGRLRPEESRFRRGRQDRKRAYGGSRGTHTALQRRVGLRVGAYSTSWQPGTASVPASLCG